MLLGLNFACSENAYIMHSLLADVKSAGGTPPFGTSLSVTTQKSIFLGHRECLDDLAIAKADYDWQTHTVIHFNWGKVEADFDVSNITNIQPIGMLYQAGYLTIADYSYGLYTLNLTVAGLVRDTGF